MDFYWNWFCDRLEPKPQEEEAEMLRTALEETLEAPPGVEPRASQQLLQQRIGNQALQRLLQMREAGRKARNRAAQTNTAAPPGPERKPEAKAVELPPPVPRPGDSPARKQAPQTAAELGHGVEVPEPKPLRGAMQATVPPAPAAVPASRTPEAQLATVLIGFVATLHQGGGESEWQALAAAAKEVSPSAREEAVRVIVERFRHLEQAPQRLCLQRFARWQKESGDQLAPLLWSRLSSSARGTPPRNQGGNDGDGL